jgi:hypothetical protein
MIVDGHFKTQFSDEGAAKKAAKEFACELPNAESRSLRRFGEGPNTDKISSLLNSMVDGRI